MLSRNVQTMLNRRGQTATLTKPNYGAYDPATGTVASGVADTYSVKCYFAEFAVEEEDDTLEGSRRVLVAPVDTSGTAVPAPTSKDTIAGLKDTVRVLKTQEIYNASTLVCYICHVAE